MSATTASIVSCDRCTNRLIHEVDRGLASLYIGRLVAHLRGWKVPMDKDGLLPSGRRSGKDYCPACVADMAEGQ